MRFLVDENLPGKVSGLLRQAGHDVFDVTASPLRGSDDATLWQTAARDQRVVVTRDLDFPILTSPHLPSGLILLRPPRGARLIEIAQLFEHFMQRVDPATVVGNVTIIEPGRIRQRALGSIRLRQ